MIALESSMEVRREPRADGLRNLFRLAAGALAVLTAYSLAHDASWGSEASNAPSAVDIFFVPHQDDETLSMGPAIEAAVHAGDDVEVVLMTNGSHAFARHLLCDGGVRSMCGQSERALQAFSRARNEEFQAALGQLGVEPSHITYENIQDETLDVAKAKEVINEQLQHYPEANLRATSWLDAHPDHHALGEALDQVCAERHFAQQRCLFYTQMYLTNPPSVERTTGVSGDQAGGHATLNAIQEYSFSNWDQGRYAIGEISVADYFAALEIFNKSHWHEASYVTAPARVSSPNP